MARCQGTTLQGHRCLNQSNGSKYCHVHAKKLWRDKKPQNQSDRVQLEHRCGSKCFLDPDHLKYPICTKNCKVDPDGVKAARARAIMNRHKHIMKLLDLKLKV